VGQNFWLRLTTASTQCLRLLPAPFFISKLVSIVCGGFDCIQGSANRVVCGRMMAYASADYSIVVSDQSRRNSADNGRRDVQLSQVVFLVFASFLILRYC